jgi:hypothetical protein
MYVWTKKAETDYRAKHPHRKNERKAGTPALWYGKELSKSFVESYAERGWIIEIVQNKAKPAKKKKKILSKQSAAKDWDVKAACYEKLCQNLIHLRQ